jgi:RNA polymerase sigma factor (sigma-70 family)
LNEYKRLKEGEEEAQFEFYDINKAAFLNFAQKYKLPQDDVVEVYQDACLVVFENAIKGKIENLNSSLKTYLFGIGKFLIFKKYKELQKQSSIQVTEDWAYTYFDPFGESDESEKLKSIRNGLKSLGKKCREVLKLYYFEEKELEEIMLVMNYESKNVLKSQKSRCLKQLKEKILNND